MDSIFHELIHVEQIINKRKNTFYKNGSFYKTWNGKSVDNLPYHEQPDEIEAKFGAEKVIDAYIQNTKNNFIKV